MSDMKQLWNKFDADVKVKAHKLEDYMEVMSALGK